MKKLLLTLGLLASVANPAFADIQFGWAGPATANGAAIGEQTHNGVSQAVEDINAKGGVLGQKITVQYEDDAGDPKQAISVANRLVAAGVQFVIGHQNSGASIPASQVYAEAGIIQITPGSTNPKLTEQGLWNVFRTCGRDDQQGTVAGDYLLKHFSGKKIFIVHDKTPYGLGLVEEVQKTLMAGGLAESGFEGIDVGQKDYAALVSKIVETGADAVYFGGNYTEGALILRQMRDQSIKIPLLGGDAMFSSEFAAIAGQGGEGTMITFGPDATKNAGAKEVVARFAEKHFNPEGFTLYAYAGVQVLAQAIQRAGTTDTETVAKVIHSGQPFDTVIGPLSYDEKGDIKRLDFVFYELKGGKFIEASGE
jgi:branched-chain amino acid transport system substrate-binding protein